MKLRKIKRTDNKNDDARASCIRAKKKRKLSTAVVVVVVVANGDDDDVHCEDTKTKPLKTTKTIQKLLKCNSSRMINKLVELKRRRRRRRRKLKEEQKIIGRPTKLLH